MISLVDNDIVVGYICNQLFKENSYWYAEEEYEDSDLVYKPPPLHYVRLNYSER